MCLQNMQRNGNLQSCTKVLGRKNHFRVKPPPPYQCWIFQEEYDELSCMKNPMNNPNIEYDGGGGGGHKSMSFPNSTANSSNNGIKCEVK